jgi:diaminopimelate epimerase
VGARRGDHARLRLGRLRDAGRLGLANRTARIGLPGGALTIEWRASDDHVLMTGPVEFEREITLGRELFAPAPA